MTESICAGGVEGHVKPQGYSRDRITEVLITEYRCRVGFESCPAQFKTRVRGRRRDGVVIRDMQVVATLTYDASCACLNIVQSHVSD